MNNLILVHYFYKNSMCGANSYTYIAENRDDAIKWYLEAIKETVTDMDKDTIYSIEDLIRDKVGIEPETATFDDGLMLHFDENLFVLTDQEIDNYSCVFGEIVVGAETSL